MSFVLKPREMPRPATLPPGARSKAMSGRSLSFPSLVEMAKGIDIREIIACVLGRIAVRIPVAILLCGALASLGGCVSTSNKGKPTIQGQSMQYMLADIEQIRAGQPFQGLARRFYSPGENGWLESIAPERQAEAFCRIWSVKEAVLKCAGLGLSVPTQKVEVVFAANAPPLVKCPGPEWRHLEHFSVQELHLVDGYASALAVDAEQADVEVLGT